MAKNQCDSEDHGHPPGDKTDWFQKDKYLRNCGFRIYERRSGEEPVWERVRDGKLFVESEAWDRRYELEE